MHALIIEDEPIIGLLIEDQLRHLGYASFDLVTTEEDAILAAGLRCPDLITSDVRLTGGCGIAAVHAICAGRAIPVRFITASAYEARVQAPEAVILAKPFHPDELGRALVQAVALARLAPTGLH